jgi:hypothetical protein
MNFLFGKKKPKEPNFNDGSILGVDKNRMPALCGGSHPTLDVLLLFLRQNFSK